MPFGGIYLYSDVMMYERMDDWLDYDLFTGIEKRKYVNNQYWIEAAIIEAKPGNLMIKEVIEIYEQKKFVLEDGRFNEIPIPNILTPVFVKHYKWIPQQRTVIIII